MTATTKTAWEVLTVAALHVDLLGHNKGDFLAADWPTLQNLAACCAAGAIRLGAGVSAADIMLNADWPAVVVEADELLAEHLIRLGWAECRDGDDLDAIETIAGWNDTDGIDAAEVAEILRDVAELAR